MRDVSDITHRRFQFALIKDISVYVVQTAYEEYWKQQKILVSRNI